MKFSLTPNQQKIVDTKNKSILVSAAAGSGKTAVLIRRIVNIISDEENPCDIDSMLVVTFTRAAACEMKERLYKALLEKLKEEGESRHLTRQMQLLYHANICTIDSFCSQIVREHYNEAGISPGYRIGDEHAFDVMKQNVLENILEEAFAKADPDFIKFCDTFIKRDNTKDVKSIILALFEESESMPNPKDWLLSLIKPYEVDTIEGLYSLDWMRDLKTYVRLYLKGLIDEAKGIIKYIDENLALNDEEVHPYMSTINDDISMLSDIAALEDDKLFAGVLGISFKRIAFYKSKDEELLQYAKIVKDKKRASLKDGVKNLCKLIPGDENEFIDILGLQKPLIKTLIDLTIRFSDAFMEKKESEGIYSFSDIEHFALRVLDVVDVKSEYSHVMVDEYQDTNHLQEALMLAITHNEKDYGNYFMVGDVKQSIYRFRHARPKIFTEKYEAFKDEDTPGNILISLSDNFRSRKKVTDFVNDMFEDIMSRDVGGIEYDGDNALISSGTFACPDNDSFNTECLLTVKDDPLVKDEHISAETLEALMIAKKIKELVGVMQISDKEGMRPLKYSDIVILHRSANAVTDKYQEVFSGLDIPLRVASVKGYLDSDEIEILMAMLSILDNPLDDIPLCCVLKHIYGFTEEDLTNIRIFNKDKKHKSFAYDFFEYAKEAGDDRASSFLDEFNTLREECADMSLSQILIHVIRKTEYRNKVALMSSPQRRLLNVERLIDLASSMEKSSFCGLYDFIQHIKDLEKYDSELGGAIEDNTDSVSLMTIHKSKGLEFPVCILSGICKRRPTSANKSAVSISDTYGASFDYIDRSRAVKVATPYKSAIHKFEELEESAESMRLLYVALTRAKEKLILCGVANNDDIEGYINEPKALNFKTRISSSTFMDLLAAPMKNCGYKITRIEPSVYVDMRVTGHIGMMIQRDELSKLESPDLEDVAKKIKERFEYKYPIKAALELKAKYSVSEIKSMQMPTISEDEEEEAQLFSLADIQDMEKTGKRRLPDFMEDVTILPENEAAMIRGTAVHRFMECADFTKVNHMEDIKNQIENMRQKGLLSDDQAKLLTTDKSIRGFEAFYESDICNRMIKAQDSGNLYRERTFVMSVPSIKLFPNMEFSKEEEDDKTLVQGIIDAFFLEDGKWILLDYKTDKTNNERDLIDRYESQLKMYRDALYKATGIEVAAMYLYSFEMGKSIKI